MFDKKVEVDETQDAETALGSQQLSTLPISSLDTFKQGQILFTVGTKRTCAYRVTKGAFCHYVRWPNGHHEFIEFVHEGDIIGFGHYQTYLTTAQALVESMVEEISPSHFLKSVEHDSILDMRFAAAGEREFEIIRQRSIGSKPRSPLKRLASYISVMASLSCKSGEHCVELPRKESLRALASLLEIGAKDMSSAFSQLKKLGFISKKTNCIVISDHTGLDKFVDSVT